MSNLSSHDPLLVDELRAALQKAEERRDELRIAWHFEKQRAQKAEEVARELLAELNRFHANFGVDHCATCVLAARATALLGDPTGSKT